MKPKEVNRYKSGVHNPEIETIVYRGENKTIVYIIDWANLKIKKIEG